MTESSYKSTSVLFCKQASWQMAPFFVYFFFTATSHFKYLVPLSACEMYIGYLNLKSHFESDTINIETKLSGAVFYGTPPQKSLPEQLEQLSFT